MSVNLCSGCLEKQRRIDQLQEEVRSLKAKLRYREQQAQQGPFGSSTPSAQIPHKANAAEGQRAKKGGARPKHPGHGRQAVDQGSADRVETVPLGPTCPYCAGPLRHKDFRNRSVMDTLLQRGQRLLYRLQRKYCPRCKKVVQARAPGVLPQSGCGNQLLTQAIFLHYFHAIPMATVCQRFGVNVGTMFQMLHRVGALFQGAIPKLIEEYRQAPVRHADETRWRTDGRSGYAWLFATPALCLFLFRSSRSARVVKEVFGGEKLKGSLVVDRYAAYRSALCALQYCYAHLLREVHDLAQEFSDRAEVRAFVATLLPLLSAAMRLHSQPLPDEEYYAQAHRLQQQIIDVTETPAQHLGIRQIQDIFRDNPDCLYQWVRDRRVPADNNRAERELRRTVIARKTSFGSQSDAGAKTREILMSVVHTLALRTADPETRFKSALDQLASDPTQDPVSLLFPLDSS